MKIIPVLLIVMLISVDRTMSGGVCILKMVDGKLRKYGDCGDKQQSQVLKDLDNKLEKLAKPKSCKDVTKSRAKVRNTTGGVFDIYLESERKVEVYCDLETDGGGWTVFQRRMDGSENFYRGWDDYVDGFGRRDKEFWLGLENLHQMTKNGNYELRVDLGDFFGDSRYAKYGSFSVDSAQEHYRLHVSSYCGNAGDSLVYHNGNRFSTEDINHGSFYNCAATFQSGGWYVMSSRSKYCHRADLNGIYHDTVGEIANWEGIIWSAWKDGEYLKFTEMKFKRKW